MKGNDGTLLDWPPLIKLYGLIILDSYVRFQIKHTVKLKVWSSVQKGFKNYWYLYISSKWDKHIKGSAELLVWSQNVL